VGEGGVGEKGREVGVRGGGKGTGRRVKAMGGRGGGRVREE